MIKPVPGFSVTGREKPYYLTRERTPDEKKIIAAERKRAKTLTAGCVFGGLAGTIVYFWVKLLRYRPK